MSASTPSLKAPLFIIVSVLAFGLGMILVIAAQKSTENRSQASLGPYTCATACSPASGGPGGAACLACMNANPTPIPTPQENPWGDCRVWEGDTCVMNAWQWKEARDKDWRCKPVFEYLHLCEPSIELPQEPQPAEDPGINP